MNASTEKQGPSRWERFRYSFPVQLFLINLKKNQVILFIWIFLFAIIANKVAAKYGVSYLFLAPEYQGERSFLSFGILGFSIGGFILGYNLYSYIIHSPRFPFLATVSRPLVKFSVNNFIFPFLFVIYFVYRSVKFQYESELVPPMEILIHILGFFAGIFLFQIISSLYFITTNKSVIKMASADEEKMNQPVKTAIPLAKRSIDGLNTMKVLTYMSSFIRVKLARDYSHYEEKLLEKVLMQNHINASLFEIVTVGSFLLVGTFGESDVFEIPAAASIVLMLTTAIMLFSALYSWFKAWTASLIILILLLINYQLVKFDWIEAESKAYGLKYSGQPTPYDPFTHALELQNDSLLSADFQHNVNILERWRKKNIKSSLFNRKKPKLVIICSSGGGSRSALWTLNCISYLDSLSDGELLRHTHMITGSSGGLVGAAYMREIYRESLLYPDSISIRDKRYADNIGRDILNPMIFRLATNDLFIRYQKFKIGEEIYTKDRGYAFERQLNENTGGVLWKTLGDYKEVEAQSVIPLLVMSPTVVNDGRRMVISSQPMSFIAKRDWLKGHVRESVLENIEYQHMFRDHSPDDLLMTSALRMNATFPFIMPSVSLPTEPEIELMDAGLRDNFGIKTALDYLDHFRNWVSTNTSGVVIVQIRDKQKNFPAKFNNQSAWSKFTAPLGSVYGNYTRMQDFTNEQLISFFSESVDYPLDVCEFQLEQEPEEIISLSWHLTQNEKFKIRRSVDLNENQASAKRLMELLK